MVVAVLAAAAVSVSVSVSASGVLGSEGGNGMASGVFLRAAAHGFCTVRAACFCGSRIFGRELA